MLAMAHAVIPLNIEHFRDLVSFEQALDDPSYEERISFSSQAAYMERLNDLLKQKIFRNPMVSLHKELVERHWDLIVAQTIENSERSRSIDPSKSTVRKLLDEIAITVLGATQGILPYGTKETSSGEDVRNLIKYLFHDIHLNCDIASCSSLQYALNDECVSASLKQNSCKEVSYLLHKLSLTLKNKPCDLATEMLVGEALSLYAFMGFPKQNDTVTVPVKINGVWKQVTYSVTLIPLTPWWLGESIPAIALEPNVPGMPPLLLFRATRGTLSWLVDFTPGFSAGRALYYLGKDNIKAWIEKVGSSETRVRIFGMSLGGALGYYTALDFPNLVEINAFAPPGACIQEECSIQGTIYFDPSDPVSLLGSHPVSDKLQMVKVIRPNSSHMRLFGGEPTLLLRVNTVFENQKILRTILAILHQVAAFPLFLILALVVLINALVRKIIDFVQCVFSSVTVPVAVTVTENSGSGNGDGKR